MKNDAQAPSLRDAVREGLPDVDQLSRGQESHEEGSRPDPLLIAGLRHRAARESARRPSRSPDLHQEVASVQQARTPSSSRASPAAVTWRKSRSIDAQVRYLDKLIDELAKGKKMETILRQ